MITYEYPLNERIRTLLRLEDLYERVRFFLDGESSHDHDACLKGIFEILEVAGRADLKSDLLQELDRQRTILEGLRNNPAISVEKLDGVLRDIDRAFVTLHALSGKTGQALRENEWLMAIKQRAGIPGGTSEFDVPSYHAWLNHPTTRRRADLATGSHRCCPSMPRSPSCCACCARAGAARRSSPSAGSTRARPRTSPRRCFAW